MKNKLLVFLISICFVSCKEEQNISTIQGEFIFFEDAAVLQQDNEVFAVKIDEQSKALAKQVEVHKTDEFDMVPVEVKAVVKENPDKDGWEKILEIKEVLSVSNKELSKKENNNN